MPIHSNITKDRDFPTILEWIDRARNEAMVRLVCSLFGAAGWTLVASFIIAFGIVFFKSFSIRQAVSGSFQPGSLLLKTFLIVLGCNLLLGIVEFFTLRNRIVEEIDKGDILEMTLPFSCDSSTCHDDCYLLDMIAFGAYGYVPSNIGPSSVFEGNNIVRFATPIAMFGQFMFLTGPGIFVNAINEKEHILKLGDETSRRRAGIVLMALFRLCGESIDIETFELEEMTWGQRLVFLAKLEKIGWIKLTDQFQKAKLKMETEQELVKFAGYKR